jgi:hypothetical protein
MDGMAPATWAKFLDRKLFGLPLLVFAGHIITPFAAIALKPDKISHLGFTCVSLFRTWFTKPTMGIGPMTSSLPRKCSAD